MKNPPPEGEKSKYIDAEEVEYRRYLRYQKRRINLIDDVCPIICCRKKERQNNAEGKRRPTPSGIAKFRG